MKPISYTKEDGGYRFNYSQKDLDAFYKRGYEFGDCGALYLAEINGVMIYDVFGTIENPSKELKSFQLHRSIPFDGEFNLEKIMNPKPIEFDKSSYSFEILDLTK